MTLEARFLDIKGVRTRYLHCGSGKPLLLLHGVGLSADCFIRNLEELGSKHAVYAIDLLGHGFTDSVDYKGAAPQQVMARHVADFAEALSLPQYSVVGSSFGALVAGLVYFLDPARVERLVLVGSGSTFHTADDQRATLSASLANGSRAMTDPTLEKCRQRLAAIVFDPSVIPPEWMFLQLTSYALTDRLDAYRRTVSGSVAAMNDDTSRVLSRLEDILCPALVVVGDDDKRADRTAHVEGAKRLPRARIETYPRCGHFPFLEYPQRFNQEVLDFLAAH